MIVLDEEEGCPPLSTREVRQLSVMQELPFVLPFEQRVKVGFLYFHHCVSSQLFYFLWVIVLVTFSVYLSGFLIQNIQMSFRKSKGKTVLLNVPLMF